MERFFFFQLASDFFLNAGIPMPQQAETGNKNASNSGDVSKTVETQGIFSLIAAGLRSSNLEAVLSFAGNMFAQFWVERSSSVHNQGSYSAEMPMQIS